MRGLFLSFICCCAAVPLMAGPSKTAMPYNQSDIDTYLARIKTTEYAGLTARATPEGQARLAFVRHMASLRQTDPAFGTDAKLVWLDNSAAKEVLSYERISPDGTSRHLCVVNLSKKPQTVDVAGRGTFELPAAGCLLK